MIKKDQDKPPPGPEPERLKIDEDWEDAVTKVLNKPKPSEGWPDTPKRGEDRDQNK